MIAIRDSRAGTPMCPSRTFTALVRALSAIAVSGALMAGVTVDAAAQIQQGPMPPQVGPENGSLVVVGGAMRSPEIYERFIDLAGGPDAHIVLVPTAGGAEEYDEFYGGLKAWRDAG